jgi:hypothetical protein
VGVLLVAGGASDCQNRLWRPALPPPVLSASPTLDEIAGVINANTFRVQSLSTSHAALQGAGFPSLRADLFVEKPGRFRLRAAHSFTGSEMDLGSNDELFWLWLKRSEPKAFFYCRHDQYAGSAMQRLIPLRPEQIIEAFGLPTIDPQGQHEGPLRVAPGRLQIRSVVAGPDGPLVRTTIVDDRMGWVLEQQLADQHGRLLASVKTSRHRRDPLTPVTLPHTIELSLPEAKLAVTIDVERYDVNAPIRPDVWDKPEEPNYPNVNLADPNRAVPATTARTTNRSPSSPASPVNPALNPHTSAYPRNRRYGESDLETADRRLTPVQR